MLMFPFPLLKYNVYYYDGTVSIAREYETNKSLVGYWRWDETAQFLQLKFHLVIHVGNTKLFHNKYKLLIFRDKFFYDRYIMFLKITLLA